MLRKWLIVGLLVGLFGGLMFVQAGGGGPLTPGEGIGGSISEPGEQDTYTYTGRINDRVTISLLGFDGLDPLLELYDPYGTLLVSNDDADLSTGNRDSLIYATLPYDGEYRIIARSFSRQSTGSYEILLSVENAAPVDGTLQLDQPVSGFLASGEYTVWTITPAESIEVEVRLTSGEFDTVVEVYDAANNILARDDDSGGDGDSYISRVTLNAGETYQVWVRSYNDTGAGEYSLVVNTLGAPPPPDQITYGTTVDGAISSGETASYSFTGDANDVITVSVNGDFDATLQLVDSSGRVIAEDDDSGGNFLPFLNGVELPADDTYTLILSGYDESSSGTFSLNLREGAVEVARDLPLNFDEPVEGFLPASEAASYVFTAEAGEVVTLSVDGSFDSVLELYDPNGSFITSNDDSGGNGNPLLEDFTLEESGEYQVVLRGFGSTSSGAYTLTLTRGDSTSTNPDKPAGTIAYGETVEGTLASGDEISYRFEAQAGDTINVIVTSNFDSVLAVLAADGSVVDFDDDSGGDGQPRLEEVVLSEAGTYTLDLRGYSSFESGDYTIFLEAVEGTSTPPAGDLTIAYGETVEGDLSAGDDARYTFTASAGDVVTISATSTYDGYLELYDAANTLIALNDDAVGFNPVIENVTLETDGTYTIAFSAFGGQDSGPFTLTLTSGSTPAATAEPTAEPTVAPTETPVSTPEPTATPEATEEAHSTAEQALIFDTPTVVTLPAGEALSFNFSGEASEQVSLAVAPVDLNSNLDLYMELYAPSGTLVALDDDSGWRLNPTLVGVTLPEAGVYQLFVRSFTGDGAGDITLTLVHGAAYLAPDGQQAQPLALETENSISAPALYELTATAGSELVINGSGVQTHLYAASGQDIETPDNRFVAPADGVYLLFVTGQGTLTVSPAAALFPPTVTPQGAIIANEPVNGNLAPNETEQWQFTPTVAGAYNIFVNSEDPAGKYDPYIRVLDASGNILAEDDDSGGSFNALLSDLNVDQPITIEVTSFAGQVGGKYLLGVVTASTLEAAVVTRGELTLDEASTPATLAAPGQQAEFSLTIDTKGLFNFDVTGLSVPVIEIVDAEGNVLALGVGTLKSQSLDPGTYTVRVYDRLNRTGEFTLLVSSAE